MRLTLERAGSTPNISRGGDNEGVRQGDDIDVAVLSPRTKTDEATIGNNWVSGEDEGGSVCVVVVLVTVQVEEVQGEYASKDKGDGEGRKVWVVVVSVQGDDTDDGEDDGEGDTTWVEYGNKEESGNAYVVIIPLLR